MKNSIGKPCEGKLHARFDEGGADCFAIFVVNRSKAIRLYSTAQYKIMTSASCGQRINLKP